MRTIIETAQTTGGMLITICQSEIVIDLKFPDEHQSIFDSVVDTQTKF
jgi:hypothetical protein